MSTFEDHARELLKNSVVAYEFICRSCQRQSICTNEDEFVLGICESCFNDIDVLPLVETDAGYVYCTCEDRPCCGCA